MGAVVGMEQTLDMVPGVEILGFFFFNVSVPCS